MSDRVLTPQEVATRTQTAVLRAIRVLADVRQTPDLWDAVLRCSGRQIAGGLITELHDETSRWVATHPGI